MFKSRTIKGDYQQLPEDRPQQLIACHEINYGDNRLLRLILVLLTVQYFCNQGLVFL